MVFYKKVDDLGNELFPPEATQVAFSESEYHLVRILS